MDSATGKRLSSSGGLNASTKYLRLADQPESGTGQSQRPGLHSIPASQSGERPSSMSEVNRPLICLHQLPDEIIGRIGQLLLDEPDQHAWASFSRTSTWTRGLVKDWRMNLSSERQTEAVNFALDGFANNTLILKNYTLRQMECNFPSVPGLSLNAIDTLRTQVYDGFRILFDAFPHARLPCMHGEDNWEIIRAYYDKHGWDNAELSASQDMGLLLELEEWLASSVAGHSRSVCIQMEVDQDISEENMFHLLGMLQPGNRTQIIRLDISGLRSQFFTQFLQALQTNCSVREIEFRGFNKKSIQDIEEKKRELSFVAGLIRQCLFLERMAITDICADRPGWRQMSDAVAGAPALRTLIVSLDESSDELDVPLSSLLQGNLVSLNLSAGSLENDSFKGFADALEKTRAWKLLIFFFVISRRKVLPSLAGVCKKIRRSGH